jgi:hypothetical protein
VVENDVLVRDCNACRQQFADGPNDARYREITPWIVVFPNYQDSRMSSADRCDKIVQILEIIVVVAQKNAVLTGGMSEVHRIIFT